LNKSIQLYLFFLLLNLSFPYAHSAEGSQSYTYEAIKAKDYEGITLNILTHEFPVMGEPTSLHAQQFEKLTGIKINIHHVPFGQLYQEALWGLKDNKYDIVFYASLWIADFHQYLAAVPDNMLRSESFVDIIPHYQNIAKWEGITYHVNIDGDRHYLQFRKDLLENPLYSRAFKEENGFELSIPRTWKELNLIAEFFNGKVLENGKKIYGIAEITDRNNLLFSQFIKRAAPYAKHPGVKDGFYFELSSMKPQINNPGFVQALQDFVKSTNYYPPNGVNFGLGHVIKSFGYGETVFSDSWDDPFVQAMEESSGISKKVAASLSPGSDRVWNRNTGLWELFPDINYVPYFAWGWTSAVAKTSSHKQAAFDYLGFFSNNENHEKDLTIGRFGVNPYRTKDLNEKFWSEKAGWDKSVAHSYVNMLSKMSSSQNRVFDLRIHKSRQYMKTLAIGVFRALSGYSTEQEALNDVAKKWDNLTEQIGRKKQRKAYSQIVEMENSFY
jgi:multiple sugar transport system substrate-binding protein